MLVGCVQRWKERRGSYRPAGEPIETRLFEVARIIADAPAKHFVIKHHYSGSYPAARERFGLYRSGELAGVAVFSVPAQPRALDVLPGGRDSGVELGRLVLLDDVPANGESWFIARCFEQLRVAGYTGVVSFSDPEQRCTGEGEVVFGGHLGTIYQATNGVYLGRSKAERRRLLPDGTMIHGRALAKIRKRDRGWRYSAALLEQHGAVPLGEAQDPVAWLARWLPALTRPMQHGGNLKYAWALNRRDRRHLPAGLPYPKLVQPVLVAEGCATGRTAEALQHAQQKQDAALRVASSRDRVARDHVG